VSHLQVCGLREIRGRMDAAQLCQRMITMHPMSNAVKNHLESMVETVQIQDEHDGCLSEICESCQEEKACLHDWWAMR
ncbi:ferrous iron transporter C, partial [Escherichia coli]|uniref:ferrous iron transporter C n=1 Tax=Escherichia coli TaxID=562 RepID=UPI001BFE0774